MAGIISLIGLVFSLVTLAGAIMVLINAFKISPTKGLLNLCVPFYLFYWVFFTEEYQDEKKPLVKKLLIVGFVGQIVCNVLARVMA